MMYSGKIILPAAIFATAVFVAEGVSGFTASQLSLFYSVLTLQVSALATMLIMAIASFPLFLGRFQRIKAKKYKLKK